MSLRSIRYVTSSETLDTAYDTFLIDASGGSITFTLNNISNDGENYIIKRIDSAALNSVTIQGFNGSQTIEGSGSVTLTPLLNITVISFTSKWYYVT